MTLDELRAVYAAQFRDHHEFTLPWEPTADERFADALHVPVTALAVPVAA